MTRTMQGREDQYKQLNGRARTLTGMISLFSAQMKIKPLGHSVWTGISFRRSIEIGAISAGSTRPLGPAPLSPWSRPCHPELIRMPK